MLIAITIMVFLILWAVGMQYNEQTKQTHALDKILVNLEVNHEKQKEQMEELNENTGYTLRSIDRSLDYQRFRSMKQKEHDKFEVEIDADIEEDDR